MGTYTMFQCRSTCPQVDFCCSWSQLRPYFFCQILRNAESTSERQQQRLLVVWYILLFQRRWPLVSNFQSWQWTHWVPGVLQWTWKDENLQYAILSYIQRLPRKLCWLVGFIFNTSNQVVGQEGVSLFDRASGCPSSTSCTLNLLPESFVLR